MVMQLDRLTDPSQSCCLELLGRTCTGVLQTWHMPGVCRTTRLIALVKRHHQKAGKLVRSPAGLTAITTAVTLSHWLHSIRQHADRG